MIKFYACENGFVEQDERGPHFWINVGCPTSADKDFLVSELGVPESFLDNIADEDERPRFEREQDWLLTIQQGSFQPYETSECARLFQYLLEREQYARPKTRQGICGVSRCRAYGGCGD